MPFIGQGPLVEGVVFTGVALHADLLSANERRRVAGFPMGAQRRLIPPSLGDEESSNLPR